MCMYMYTYVCIYTYTHIVIFTYIYIYIYTHTYICVCVYMEDGIIETPRWLKRQSGDRTHTQKQGDAETVKRRNEKRTKQTGQQC